ncbi:MAG TPA: sigma-54 dependent transcriptional regulator [Thermoanaerobaculia bacterium]|nr:sigma-54 dependent transcriptional regulator [Thermoanaerobaculia bacterium]
MATVLVADDEEGVRSFLAEALESAGHRVAQAADGDEAARLLDQRSFHLLVTDLKMPGLDGMALLRKVKAEQPETEVLVLTAHGSVDGAVEAMKLGALDYLQKPLSGPDEIRLLAERAAERFDLRALRDRAVDEAAEGPPLTYGAPAMAPVVAALRKVAPTQATVLLLGESGTGKEVAARAVHRWSPRRGGPFVPVNCAAVSEHLLDSDLLGLEKCAFTGAAARHRGRLELAAGGTVFLDEIAELRPELQVKLLRVLQERRFERVGGTRTLEADVRWIAATNRDLEERLRSGAFRDDLYHRLAVFPVRMPPLRERREDVLPLARTLLGRISRELGRPAPDLSPEAERLIETSAWPGNVRELANALERAAILTEDGTITPGLLTAGPRPHAAGSASPGSRPAGEAPATTLEDLERQAILRALERHHGHRRHAAHELGIGERTLYDKLKRYGLR